MNCFIRTSKRLLPTFALILLMTIIGTSDGSAQIKTYRGDFFRVTRTINQTADSVEFISDTLTVGDVGGNIADFLPGDSVAIFFVQDRFRIVNQFSSGFSDSIRVSVNSATTISLARQGYGPSIIPGSGRILGLKPFFRPVGNIASSSNFNSSPAAIRQMMSVGILTPSPSADKFSIRRILFKPNIANLTYLAPPPDTTKDTLRAYHLDGSGNVVNATDLAIVRLLPGMTRMLVWVNDSAQDVDAGEFIGSFGDYSRGRYFLGDTNPESPTSSPFRPSMTNPVTGGPNPDYGLRVDGGLIPGSLYETLKPMTGGGYYDNPINGLIPPYRVDYHTHLPDDPEFVTSAVDTLRLIDEFGNRTWDTQTSPSLKAIVYDVFGNNPADRTSYLKGYSGINDVLRQKGQVIYRRLHYTHADIQQGQQSPEDYFRIIAQASVTYYDQGGIQRTLQALPDTSGGFPRTSLLGGVVVEPPRTGFNGVPASGTKCVSRPNIPRRVYVVPSQSQFTVGSSIDLRIMVADDWGNAVENGERFKLEMSPFSQRLGGRFDSLNALLDSGVVSVTGSDIGQARRTFRAATGSNNAGYYTIRVRASWSQSERTDPQPGDGFLHMAFIPDGSPNNNFGVIFGPGMPGFGNKMGQTTAIDSVVVFASPANPVELASFHADEISGGILLTWITESETNNRGFFVERRLAGTGAQWTNVGFVRGNGTVAGRHSYSYIDPFAMTGPVRLIYRLRQVDIDGTEEYSPEVEITPSVQSRSFVLGQNYPNPISARGDLSATISYSVPTRAEVMIKLYDVLGGEVATIEAGSKEAGIHHVRFPVTGLSKGMYFYKLFAGRESVAARKLLIID